MTHCESHSRGGFNANQNHRTLHSRFILIFTLAYTSSCFTSSFQVTPDPNNQYKTAIETLGKKNNINKTMKNLDISPLFSPTITLSDDRIYSPYVLYSGKKLLPLVLSKNSKTRRIFSIVDTMQTQSVNHTPLATNPSIPSTTSSLLLNKKWILEQRPNGIFNAETDVKLVKEQIELSASCKDDEVVIETSALSVDAFIRTMLDEEAYHGAIGIGSTIPALGKKRRQVCTFGLTES